MNDKHYCEGEFPDCYEFTLYMIFAIYPKMAIPITAICVQIFKKSCIGKS